MTTHRGLYELVRSVDVSGVSGTGVVAEVAVFSDGSAAVRWHTPGHPASFATWEGGMADVLDVHGHGGSTVARRVA